jgi:hypothetical protein
VSVQGCIEKRAEELGGLAVDIALVGIQLVVPHIDFVERITRLNARALPPFMASVSTSQGALTSSGRTKQRFVAPEAFNEWMREGLPVLASVGKRVEEFLTRKGTLRS